MDKQDNYPICQQSSEVVDILYAFPSLESFEKAKRKEIYLGACMMTDGTPTHYWEHCHIKFDQHART